MYTFILYPMNEFKLFLNERLLKLTDNKVNCMATIALFTAVLRFIEAPWAPRAGSHDSTPAHQLDTPGLS